MRSKEWMTAGWVFMAATAGLASLSALLVFTSIERDTYFAFTGRDAFFPPVRIHVSSFVGGVVAAVLAGATFFLGLASFFWSASLARQAVLEEILRRLPEPAQPAPAED
ncbi:hypothetical protein AB0J52_03660 [Spirillospora sp. NPDC049652]